MCCMMAVSSASGTTSACAENTPLLRFPSPPSWNYLRVRGEYFVEVAFNANSTELPPRARRILGPYLAAVFLHRTTSACAENTGTAP